MADAKGVWRTVGGRRVFIADGEDLQTAMKKSGKFKNLKDDVEKPNDGDSGNAQNERIKKYTDEELEKELLNAKKQYKFGGFSKKTGEFYENLIKLYEEELNKRNK